MADVVKMPKLGLTMTSGKISRWKKKVGDRVTAGEGIVEIETDKITSEVEAPVDGYILEILAEEGDEKEITAPLCVIGEQAGSAAPARIFVTPVARLLAREHGVDYTAVMGTGPGGRIVKKDILAVAEQKEKAKIGGTPIQQANHGQTALRPSDVRSAAPKAPEFLQDSDAMQPTSPQQSAAGLPTALQQEVLPSVIKKVPLAGVRKVIARRLSQSKRDIPHTYFKISVEVDNLIEFKNKVSGAVHAKSGKKLSLNDLIIKASASVLEEFPDMNASLVNDEILYYGSVNIGMAVNSEKGLIVPVIHNAGRKSLSEICRNAATLIDKAKNGTLGQEDISGGTFTVSNLGAYPIDEFTAIINPPESAILAVGRAAEAPCAKNGELVIRTLMKLTLSVDHRIIDGALAARFMTRLKELLEDPYYLMI